MFDTVLDRQPNTKTPINERQKQRQYETRNKVKPYTTCNPKPPTTLNNQTLDTTVHPQTNWNHRRLPKKNQPPKNPDSSVTSDQGLTFTDVSNTGPLYLKLSRKTQDCGFELAMWHPLVCGCVRIWTGPGTRTGSRSLHAWAGTLMRVFLAGQRLALRPSRHVLQVCVSLCPSLKAVLCASDALYPETQLASQT